MILFLLNSLFSTDFLGSYSFASGILGLPINLLAASLSTPFYQKAASLKDNLIELSQVSRKINWILLVISIPSFLVVIFFGRSISVLFFGNQWNEAGLIMQILALPLFFTLLSSPYTEIFNIFEKQKIPIVINITTIALSAGAFYIGYYFDNRWIAISLYSFVTALTHLFIIILALKIIDLKLAKKQLLIGVGLMIAFLSIYGLQILVFKPYN